MALYRHGDVLIETVPALPGDASSVPGHVLVRGELSGHAHRIETPVAASLFRAQGNLYVQIHAPTRVVHEEHAPIALSVGVYRVWQQREYTPREIRTVVD